MKLAIRHVDGPPAIGDWLEQEKRRTREQRGVSLAVVLLEHIEQQNRWAREYDPNGDTPGASRWEREYRP